MQTTASAHGAPLRELLANESLNEDLAAQQLKVVTAPQQATDVCAAEWNAVHDANGSFADGHLAF